MKKSCLGYTRVKDMNGTRKDYETLGLRLSRKNAVSLAKSILKTTTGRKNVVLTVFKNRVNDEGMRMIVSS